MFFLQLRIADEFKDFEEDSRFRPYRPVPRGLVKLRELGWLFVLGAGVQLALALWLAPRMALLLLLPWGYLAGMSKEFGCRDWLKARPVTYLWTHMLIMPLVDFYATGCDWLASGASPPASSTASSSSWAASSARPPTRSTASRPTRRSGAAAWRWARGWRCPR